MRRSPRFVVRVLAASFATVVLVLAAVFTVLILHTRSLVQRSVVDNLEAGQRLLALFERERQHEGALQATVLTESPTLKAALDIWQSEMAMPERERRVGVAGGGHGRERSEPAREPAPGGRGRRRRRSTGASSPAPDRARRRGVPGSA